MEARRYRHKGMLPHMQSKTTKTIIKFTQIKFQSDWISSGISISQFLLKTFWDQIRFNFSFFPRKKKCRFCSSVPQLCPTLCNPWTEACQAFLSFTMSQNLLKLASIDSVMLPNHLIHCHLLLLLPSVFPSLRVISIELVPHIRWPKFWNFSFSIGPSNEYSGLISLRIDWSHLLAIQGTLKLISFKC